jgi:hypothetical protein
VLKSGSVERYAALAPLFGPAQKTKIKKSTRTHNLCVGSLNKKKYPTQIVLSQLEKREMPLNAFR